MTPLEEIPQEMPTEAPGMDCEAVKKEWDTASKTGKVSAELMQKALQCKLVPQDKVKGMPTGENIMPPAPTREENPLAGEDKELGMAELTMAYDPWTGETTFGDTPISDAVAEAEQQLSDGYTLNEDTGNWETTSAFDSSYLGTGRPYTPDRTKIDPYSVNNMDKSGYNENKTLYMEVLPNETRLYSVQIDSNGKEIKNYLGTETYYDSTGNPTTRENAASVGRRGTWGGQEAGGGTQTYDQEGQNRIVSQQNYFGQPQEKPDDIGNMEWRYKYNYGMGSNAFNPEQYYFNPDDKGNAGQTSSPYARIGNRGNMTPEVVQTNRPFYNTQGIDKYTNQDEIKFKQRNMQMAESMPTPGDTPTGAAVDQMQGQTQEVDETMQEQIKEALSKAGFNVVDMEASPDGKILVSVGQFEDSYIENAQFFEVDFELAEPMNCKRRFKAIAVTPGMYKAKDGTLVELASADLQKIATLFRNKPLVLVDHELARPDSTHEGRNVGYVEDSWYDENYDAVIYKGALNEDLDLASIAGSSIKLSHGATPMGRHIALIPKCISGIACYAPQDPNAVILENAQHIGVNKMNITPEQAAAIKQELGSINKQKEKAIDAIIRTDIEAGELKDNIFDKSRDLWKKDVTTLLEMATVKDTGKKETPTTKGKVEGKKELSLAEKLQKGEIDEDTALEEIIKKHEFFK